MKCPTSPTVIVVDEAAPGPATLSQTAMVLAFAALVLLARTALDLLLLLF